MGSFDTLDGFRFNTRFGPYVIKVEKRVTSENEPRTESGTLKPSRDQNGPAKFFLIKVGQKEFLNPSFWQALADDCKEHVEDDSATGPLIRIYEG
jgi:hypothetical protein